MPINNVAICTSCKTEYDIKARKGNKGKITVCDECGEEEETAVKYTGVMIYSCKTNCSIQINADPRLTQYINDTTKLKNKGSNMGNNINQVSKHKKLVKTHGACIVTADAVDYKNKNGI
jgi:hypothetical protein